MKTKALITNLNYVFSGIPLQSIYTRISLRILFDLPTRGEEISVQNILYMNF